MLLIAGDELRAEEGGLVGPSEWATPDMESANASLGKLTEHQIDYVLCYHGGLYGPNASEKIAQLRATATGRDSTPRSTPPWLASRGEAPCRAPRSCGHPLGTVSIYGDSGWLTLFCLRSVRLVVSKSPGNGPRPSYATGIGLR